MVSENLKAGTEEEDQWDLIRAFLHRVLSWKKKIKLTFQIEQYVKMNCHDVNIDMSILNTISVKIFTMLNTMS